MTTKTDPPAGTTGDPAGAPPAPPAGAPPAPPAGSSSSSEITPERFAALEGMVTELGNLFRQAFSPGGGEGTGSAATGTPPPPPVPADRDGIRAMVRDLLEARDGESRLAKMTEELEELRGVVAERLAPPKRGWGSWIIGSKP